MINNQAVVLVEHGVAKGVSKGHRGILFQDGDLNVVDGEGVKIPMVPSNVNGITGASAITNIVSISQLDYDALAETNSSTLYVIVG